LSDTKPSKKSGKSAIGVKSIPVTGKSAMSGPMDVHLLEQICKLMEANDLNTVDVRDGERRIILKRGVPEYVAMAPSPVASVAPPAASPAAPAAAPIDEDAGLIPIKSPMVGTFYAASSPEAKPFVSVGAHVDDDSDVCVIEAMKVFNNIKAETKGTIAKILVNNGQPVEFGQTLFLVKP